MSASKKTQLLRKLYYAVSMLWVIPFALCVTLLTLYAFYNTIRYKLYDELDRQVVVRENPVFFFLLVIVALVILFFLTERISRYIPPRGIFLLPLAVCTVISLYLIFAVRGLAVNDAKTIDAIVNHFMEGSYDELTRTGSYLYIYAFQIGYVFYGQLLAMLFGPSNYLVYQLLNLCSVLITLYLLYRITQALFENTEITDLAALLSCGMLFLFVYTTHIYNDIPSLAPQTASMYAAIRYLKNHRVRDGILCTICLAIATVLKTNAYISLIAIVIILISDALLLPRAKTLFLCALITLCALGAPRLVRAGYAQAAGIPVSEMPEGVPSSAYFAMAIQETDAGQSGWYNGYNVHVFSENGFDVEQTDAAARERFHKDMDALLRNPSHMAYFYFKKFVSQWSDPSFVSMRNLELESRHIEGHSHLVNSIIYGKGMHIFYRIMDVYQAICYFGCLIYCTQLFRRIKSTVASHKFPLYLCQSFLLLFVFGGMLFHEIWEGSSRYALRYFVILLPFAAYGLHTLSLTIKGIAGKG